MHTLGGAATGLRKAHDLGPGIAELLPGGGIKETEPVGGVAHRYQAGGPAKLAMV